MKRMVSSVRPFGAVSVSMSVTNPYLYFSPVTARTVSIVSGEVAITRPDTGLLLGRAFTANRILALAQRRQALLDGASRHHHRWCQRHLGQRYSLEGLP